MGIFDDIGDFFTDGYNSAKNGVSDAWDWTKGAAGTVYHAGESIVNKGMNIFDRVTDNLLNFGNLLSNPLVIGLALLAALVIVPKVIEKI